MLGYVEVQRAPDAEREGDDTGRENTVVAAAIRFRAPGGGIQGISAEWTPHCMMEVCLPTYLSRSVMVS